MQQDRSPIWLGTAWIVGQDGIQVGILVGNLRDDWQSPLLGYRHRLRPVGNHGYVRAPNLSRVWSHCQYELRRLRNWGAEPEIPGVESNSPLLPTVPS